MSSDPDSEILQYLPHRPPFVMIDEIVAEKDGPARSRLTIREDNVLVSDGRFTAGGLVEHMAQTAGAATGMIAQAEGKPPGLGYIGALKDLVVTELPAVGQSLETEVIFVHQVMQALIVRGTVRSEGRLCATCELKIFLL